MIVRGWRVRLLTAFLLATATRSDGAIVQRERVEISAPILPSTKVIYAAFPTTLEGERAMAHAAALTFDRLLGECAAEYPAITPPPADGTPLTPQQLAANYNSVGECAYQKYTAKPYWIPRLIADVDICGTELGAGWRLITEADLVSLVPPDFQFVQDTLTPLATTGGDLWGAFYFGSSIWVRGNDGVIKAGTLAPGVVGSRVQPLTYQNGFDETKHYEGGLSLRCIRRTDLP